MSKALSLDLRTRVLAAIAGGMSCRKAAERFGVSASSAIRWRARERLLGDARPKALGGDRRSGRIEAHAETILALVEEVRRRGASVSEYRVDVGSPRLGNERVVDVFASPLGDDGVSVVLMLQERTIADKMDRQLTHRGAARSITALGSMLAHGEPDSEMGQGESTEQAAQGAEAPATSAPAEPTSGPGNGHGALVSVDFGNLGPGGPDAA